MDNERCVFYVELYFQKLETLVCIVQKACYWAQRKGDEIDKTFTKCHGITMVLSMLNMTICKVLSIFLMGRFFYYSL